RLMDRAEMVEEPVGGADALDLERLSAQGRDELAVAQQLGVRGQGAVRDHGERRGGDRQTAQEFRHADPLIAPGWGHPTQFWAVDRGRQLVSVTAVTGGVSPLFSPGNRRRARHRPETGALYCRNRPWRWPGSRSRTRRGRRIPASARVP